MAGCGMQGCSMGASANASTFSNPVTNTQNTQQLTPHKAALLQLGISPETISKLSESEAAQLHNNMQQAQAARGGVLA